MKQLYEAEQKLAEFEKQLVRKRVGRENYKWKLEAQKTAINQAFDAQMAAKRRTKTKAAGNRRYEAEKEQQIYST